MDIGYCCIFAWLGTRAKFSKKPAKLGHEHLKNFCDLFHVHALNQPKNTLIVFFYIFLFETYRLIDISKFFTFQQPLWRDAHLARSKFTAEKFS